MRIFFSRITISFLLILSIPSFVICQKIATKEDVFFNYIASKKNIFTPNIYYNFYVRNFDHNKYLAIANNEFDRKDFSSVIEKKVRDGVNETKDAERFYYSVGPISIGEYDFNLNAFVRNDVKFTPLAYNYIFYPLIKSEGDRNVQINTASVDDFPSFNLKMSPADARKFLEQKKDVNGSTNKNIIAVLKFRFINDIFGMKDENILTIYVDQVDLYSDNSLKVKLASIKSNNPMIKGFSQENLFMDPNKTYLYLHNERDFYFRLEGADEAILTFSKINGNIKAGWKTRIWKENGITRSDFFDVHGELGGYFTVKVDKKISLFISDK